MKKIQICKLFLSVTLLFFFSCKKADDSPVGTVKGNITLYLTVQHHSWVIPGTQVYMKSYTTEFPGTNPSAYNLKTVTAANGIAEFKELTFGNYYLYTRGWDPVFADTVHGYMPVVLDKISVVGNRLDVMLYVTE